MGFMKDIHLEIMEWLGRGCTVEETYIYFKDYVTLEDVRRIHDEDLDKETV
jgi:hypothetical protein